MLLLLLKKVITEMHLEKNRKAYFEIGANKKERILSKAVRFFASNIMDSTIDHQMHGLGIIMNESCESSLAE
jgi:coenzyme F420-reducing hydrogenase delta subunit